MVAWQPSNARDRVNGPASFVPCDVGPWVSLDYIVVECCVGRNGGTVRAHSLAFPCSVEAGPSGCALDSATGREPKHGDGCGWVSPCGGWLVWIPALTLPSDLSYEGVPFFNWVGRDRGLAALDREGMRYPATDPATVAARDVVPNPAGHVWPANIVQVIHRPSPVLGGPELPAGIPAGGRDAKPVEIERGSQAGTILRRLQGARLRSGAVGCPRSEPFIAKVQNVLWHASAFLGFCEIGD